MKTRTLATWLLAGMLLAAACAADEPAGETPPETSTTTTAPPTTSVPYPHGTAPSDLVLRVESGGGFVPIEFALSNHPEFSLMGDGSAITGAAQIAIFPPPALPALQTRTIEEAGIQAILAEADRAGLLAGDTHYDYPCVADAATTTFTVTVDGVTSVTTVYALGIETTQLEPEAPLDTDLPPPVEDAAGADAMRCDLSDEELAARAALVEFAASLSGLEMWLPEGSVGPAVAFEPDGMRTFAGPYQGSGDLPQESVVWPLDTGLDAFGDPVPFNDQLRCGVLEGTDLQEVVSVAATTNTLTPWLSDGAEWRLVFRALLPDESGCTS